LQTSIIDLFADALEQTMNEGQNKIISTQAKKEQKEKEKANFEQKMQDIQDEIDKLNAEDFDAQLEKEYTTRRKEISDQLKELNIKRMKLSNDLSVETGKLAANENKNNNMRWDHPEKTVLNTSI
jgi:chromosome segregation ATPase